MNEQLTQLVADMAEQIALGEELREAKNRDAAASETRQAESAEVRRAMIQLMDKTKDDPSSTADYWRGEMIKLGGKTETRKAFLRIIETVREQSRHFVPSENPLTSQDGKSNYALSQQQGIVFSGADRLFKDGKYAEALEICVQLLKENRELYSNPTVLGHMMNCYYRLDNFVEAIVYGRRILVLEKQNMTAMGIVATAALYLGNYDEAFMHAERMIRLDPQNELGLAIASRSGNLIGQKGKAREYRDQLARIQGAKYDLKFSET